MTQKASGGTAATASGGTSFGFILFIVFLILRLRDTVDWSWWWVTAPLWIPAALAVVIVLIALPFALRKH